MIIPGLYTGPIMHRRLRPRRHHFSYQAMWLLLDLDDLLKPTWLFSLNRFNLLSFYNKDHADGFDQQLRGRIATQAASQGINTDGCILLFTMPRILGFGFNPLSMYFCYNAAKQLSGIVWEVTNTFKQRQTYVLPVNSAQQGTIRQRCTKTLYVSPFIDMGIEYRFRVDLDERSLSIGIADYDNEGVLLTAAFRADWRPVTNRNLVAAVFGTVTFPFKTLLAIHWQALKLFLKGVRLVPRLKS